METEISAIEQVGEESSRLYALLQNNVDREIQQPGFMPGETFGFPEPDRRNGRTTSNGNGGHRNGRSKRWACSDKQRDLILKVVEENSLDKSEIDALAQERFGKSVVRLNKLEASGLIDELLERHGDKP